MKFSKPNVSKDELKLKSSREEKKSVNIKWNSKLFFQLSLIVCLLMAYFAIQTEFEIKEKAMIIPNENILDEVPMIIYKLEETVKAPKKEKPIKKHIAKPKVLQKVKKIDNGSLLETTPSDINEPNSKEDILPLTSIGAKKNKEGEKSYNVIGVEHVPLYPGCEKMLSNIEKRNCMSSKIKTFIQRKFNADKFDHLPKNEKQVIYVQFYIDENGYVSDIIAKAKDISLKKEAIRVVSKLPKMKPGRQGDKVVKVQYMIPIAFKLD